MSATCRWCGGSSVEMVLAADLNQQRGATAFAYRRCESCGLVFLPDVPGDLDRYYPTSYHELPPRQRMERLAARQRSNVAMLRRWAPSGALLEIGPGSGAFALAAKDAGFDVEVVERSGAACEHLTRVVGVRVLQSDAPHKALEGCGPYDAAVLWHVLEHLPEPVRALQAIAASLRRGGALLVATPNPDALQFRAFGAAWWHLDAPRHLQLLPFDALDRSLGSLGFRQVWRTTRDRDGLSWNVQGWQGSLRNAGVPRGLARAAGAAVGIAAAPVEATGLRGTTYTGIWRMGR